MIESHRVGDLVVLAARPARATRRPVLFVHGYFVDASIWAEWLPFFAERGFPAYAVNLRGRSGSRTAIDLGRATIADFVDDALAAMEWIETEHGLPAAVGHSMGGLVVQRLAAAAAAAAAVLVAPAPPRGISVLSPRVAARQIRYLPALFAARPVHVRPADLAPVAFNRLAPAERDAMVQRLLPDSGRAGFEMSIAGVPVDARDVRCPVLVVSGDDDRFVPLAVARRVARRYRAPIQVFPGRGHMLILEHGWREIADAIARWLA